MTSESEVLTEAAKTSPSSRVDHTESAHREKQYVLTGACRVAQSEHLRLSDEWHLDLGNVEARVRACRGFSAPALARVAFDFRSRLLTDCNGVSPGGSAFCRVQSWNPHRSFSFRLIHPENTREERGTAWLAGRSTF
jgi:hypothetical protein